MKRKIRIDEAAARINREKEQDADANGERAFYGDRANLLKRRAELGREQLNAKNQFGARTLIGDLEKRRRFDPVTNPVRRLVTAFRVADRSAVKHVYSLDKVKGTRESRAVILDRAMRNADITSNDRQYLLERIVGTKVKANADFMVQLDRSDMQIALHTVLTCMSGGSGAAADRSDHDKGYFYAGAFKDVSFRVRHLLNGYGDPRRLFTIACSWLNDSLEFPHGADVPGFVASEVRDIPHKLEHMAVAFLCYSLSRLAEAWGDDRNHMLLVGRSALTAANRLELIQQHLCQAIRNVLVGARRLTGNERFETPRLNYECNRLSELDASNMGQGAILTPNLNGRNVSRLTGARYRAFGAECSKVNTSRWSTLSEIQLLVKNIDWSIPAPQTREYALCRASSRIYPSASALKTGLDAATRAADDYPAMAEPVTHWEFHAPSKTFIAHVAEYGDPAGAVTYSLATMLGYVPGEPLRDKQTGELVVRSPCPPCVWPLEVVFQVFDAIKDKPWCIKHFRGCSIYQLLFRLEGEDKVAFTEFGKERTVHGLVFGPRDTPNVVASILRTVRDTRKPLPAPRIPAWAFGGADSSVHDVSNALLEMAIEACELEIAMATQIREGCAPDGLLVREYQSVYGNDHEMRGTFDLGDGKASQEDRSSISERTYSYADDCVKAAVEVKVALEKFRAHRCFIDPSESHISFMPGSPWRRISGLFDKLRDVVKYMPRFYRGAAPYVVKDGQIFEPRPEVAHSSATLLQEERAKWEKGVEDMYMDSPSPYPSLAGAMRPDESQIVNALYDENGAIGLRPVGWYNVVRSMTDSSRDTA